MQKKITTPPIINFNQLADKWPSAFVARHEVANFSGGIINCKTLANLDSIGKGPARVRIGRKIAYRADDLISWLEARATACPKKNAA